MRIFDLNTILSKNEQHDLLIRIKNIPWLDGVPGGFLTNKPKRKVYSFGNGQGLWSKNEGGYKPYGPAFDSTFWTAKVNQSNTTLESKTNAIPKEFYKVIGVSKRCFQESMTNVKINPFTFSIAVCNYYTQYEDYIAAHTDDNMWYPHECEEGPVFASLTIYPEKKPTSNDEYARFQIKRNGKWEGVQLKDMSLMIMESSIEHRVMAHTKRNKDKFCPRINITFRSTYNPTVNPLMHLMAFSNHNRYYSVPKSLRVDPEMNPDTVNAIAKPYMDFLKKSNLPRLDLVLERVNKRKRKEEFQQQFKRYKGPHKSNMVPELYNIVIGRYFVLEVVSLMGTKETYTVDKNMFIGQWLCTFSKNHEHIQSVMVQKEKKYFGYDYDCSKKFTEYEEFEGTVRVLVFTNLEYSVKQYNIAHPINYFINGMQFPPTENWKNGDPLNLAPFLIWNGWGRGPFEVPKDCDNSFNNLVVIEYDNGVRHVVNMYAYSIAIDSGRDPLTNRDIDKNSVLGRIVSVLKEGSETAKRGIIPTIKINFV